MYKELNKSLIDLESIMINNYSRIDKHYMFSSIAKLVSFRSTCSKRKVGCIIVQNDSIISMGYNGSRKGSINCIDTKSICGSDENNSCFEAIHAEQNAIAFATKTNNNLNGFTLYSTLTPCLSCSKLLLASGIHEMYYIDLYRNIDGLTYLINSGINCVNLKL